MAIGAYGFKPLKYLDGSPYTGALQKATLTAAAVAYGRGDPLELDAAGTLSRAEAADTLIVGVLQYMEWTDASGDFHQDNYISTTASLTVTAYYVPVEGLIFLVRPDNIGNDVDTNDIGMNYDFVVTAADSTRKISQVELDSSSYATTSTLPLKFLGLYDCPGNAYSTTVQTSQGQTDVDLEVIFNAHRTHPGTTGI